MRGQPFSGVLSYLGYYNPVYDCHIRHQPPWAPDQIKAKTYPPELYRIRAINNENRRRLLFEPLATATGHCFWFEAEKDWGVGDVVYAQPGITIYGRVYMFGS